MTVTISQYIEALQNPNGRFRTLKGIYPVTDDSGEPKMQAGELCADFEVVFDGDRCVLKCLLGASAKHRERLKDVALFTQLIDTPYLLPHTYLEDEVTVFDASGQAFAADAILFRKPDGMTLRQLLDGATGNGAADIWEAGSRLAAMARWLWENKFSTGSVSCKTLTIKQDGIPALTDCTYAQRKPSLTDIRALCALEAALYCLACEPRLYKPFLEEYLTGRSKLIALAGTLNELLEDEETGTLTGLLALLSAESANYDEYVAYLFELADKLASEKPVRIGSLADMADALAAQPAGNGTKQDASADAKLSKYTFLGEPGCNLMRAFDGREWCYVDKTGKAAISGGFSDASDFEEGRAVVETAKGFGLIDTDGKFILDAAYDDIDWDSFNNIAVATKNGKSGIFSRMGEPLTGLSFDHILNCSEGLIPAKKNGRYGYLRRDGSVAIDFMFDDAFGFRDRVARVRRSGHEIIIDTEGCEIDRIIK